MDRKEARKLWRQMQKPNFNADEFLESMGVEVPYVENEPQLSDYELPSNTAEMIEEDNKKFEQNQKTIAKITFTTIAAVGVIIGYSMEGIGGALGGGFLGLYIGVFSMPFIFDRKPRETPFRRKFTQFETDRSNYEYWKRKKSRDYWKGLSGRGFEAALAQLFRKKGFDVTVSKAGGDKGVDLILEMNHQKTLVQCKAHAKPVGPSVARDLYGTMLHFNARRAILASTQGFTVGTYEFVKDKPIELLGLDEILKIANSI